MAQLVAKCRGGTLLQQNGAIAKTRSLPERGAYVWNAGRGARVAPRDYTGGDIRRGGGAITVHCRLLSGGAGKTPPFYKHRVDAPLQAYRQDHPHEEAEQRRDMPRRELPAMAPQDWAHNPKEREPRGSGVTSALGKNDCITQHYPAHLTQVGTRVVCGIVSNGNLEGKKSPRTTLSRNVRQPRCFRGYPRGHPRPRERMGRSVPASMSGSMLRSNKVRNNESMV